MSKPLISQKKLGAEILARTVVALDDDTLVNFLYRIDGLKDFTDEYDRAEVLDWLGREIRVLPLPRIIASKKHIRRPKDNSPSPSQANAEIKKEIRRIAVRRTIPCTSAGSLRRLKRKCRVRGLFPICFLLPRRRGHGSSFC